MTWWLSPEPWPDELAPEERSPVISPHNQSVSFWRCCCSCGSLEDPDLYLWQRRRKKAHLSVCGSWFTPDQCLEYLFILLHQDGFLENSSVSVESLNWVSAFPAVPAQHTPRLDTIFSNIWARTICFRWARSQPEEAVCEGNPPGRYRRFAAAPSVGTSHAQWSYSNVSLNSFNYNYFVYPFLLLGSCDLPKKQKQELDDWIMCFWTVAQAVQISFTVIFSPKKPQLIKFSADIVGYDDCRPTWALEKHETVLQRKQSDFNSLKVQIISKEREQEQNVTAELEGTIFLYFSNRICLPAYMQCSFTAILRVTTPPPPGPESAGSSWVSLVFMALVGSGTVPPWCCEIAGL